MKHITYIIDKQNGYSSIYHLFASHLLSDGEIASFIKLLSEEYCKTEEGKAYLKEHGSFTYEDFFTLVNEEACEKYGLIKKESISHKIINVPVDNSLLSYKDE